MAATVTMFRSAECRRDAATTINRRRRISPEAGRALEILSHAIEYLTDEHIYEGGTFRLADPRVQAMMMMMERNREIYFAYPVVPTLGERLMSWLNPKIA